MKKLEPPNNLSPEGKVWWKKLAGKDMDQAAILILNSAIEAFDMMKQAGN